MPDVTIEVEVYCESCGEGLCNQTTFCETYHRRCPSFRVEPCQRCLDAAKREGYDEGYDEGYEVGIEKRATL